MATISYTTLRKKLSSTMNEVAENREVLHITRKGHTSMVMLTEDDFNAMEETMYLLSSKNNLMRLNEAFRQAENNEFIEMNWDEN